MRATILLPVFALMVAGCDRTTPRADNHADDADNIALAAGARQANEMMAQTRQEALEARVATLENQMDTLKAEVDTRTDLGAALAPAAAPIVPPPPAAPKLPYEPPNGNASN